MISTGTLASVMRYGLTLFPAFILLAHVGRRRWFDWVYTAGAAGLSGLLLTLYVAGSFVA